MYSCFQQHPSEAKYAIRGLPLSFSWLHRTIAMWSGKWAQETKGHHQAHHMFILPRGFTARALPAGDQGKSDWRALWEALPAQVWCGIEYSKRVVKLLEFSMPCDFQYFYTGFLCRQSVFNVANHLIHTGSNHPGCIRYSQGLQTWRPRTINSQIPGVHYKRSKHIRLHFCETEFRHQLLRFYIIACLCLD